MPSDTTSDTNDAQPRGDTQTSHNHPGFNTALQEYIGRLGAATARATEVLEINTEGTGVNGNESRETSHPFIRVTVSYPVENDENPSLATIELRPSILSNDTEDVFFGYSVRVGLSSQNIGKTPLETMWYDSINWEALGVGNAHIQAFSAPENSTIGTFDFGYKSPSAMPFSDAIDVLCEIVTAIREHKDAHNE